MALSEARAIMEYEPLFGAWHVVRRIGAGAAGSVYEIERDDDNGVTLRSAMKVISIPAGGEEELKTARFTGMSEHEIESYYQTAAARVTAEIDMLKKLRGSKNIVSCEESEIRSHRDGIGWDILVRMELLTPMLDFFDDLSRHNDAWPDETWIVRMGLDLCSGLEDCRANDIVHRDIKPANIFVSGDGDFKLGDFGIARIIEETQTSLSRKGTYTYMAPEVYHGAGYGHTADIYSLGMVMYQCLNDGRNMFVPPFPEKINIDDNEKAFARRIVGRKTPPPRHGSDALKAIVLKACAFDKSERYQSASAMRSDLEALQAGDTESITALRKDFVTSDDAVCEEAVPERSDPAKRRRRAVITASITGILALSGIAFAILFPWSIDSITVRNEGTDLGSGTEIYIGDKLTPDYVISPDHYKDAKVEFTSSDESVFSVSQEGTITAEGLGEATLIMSAADHTRDDFAETFTVAVRPKITSITLLGSENRVVEDTISLDTGTSSEYKVKLLPDQFRDEELSCRIKDRSVAEISSLKDEEDHKSLTLTAKKAGKTNIKFSSGGCSIKMKIVVTDPPAPVIYNSTPAEKSRRSSRKSSGKTPSKGEFGDYEYFD